MNPNTQRLHSHTIKARKRVTMNEDVSHLKRLLFNNIYRRLKAIKRVTDDPRFNKYRKLWTQRCNTISNPDILTKELVAEIERIKNLEKKMFKIEFGKRRVWDKKNRKDRLICQRTLENEMNSKRLHKPITQ